MIIKPLSRIYAQSIVVPYRQPSLSQSFFAFCIRLGCGIAIAWALRGAWGALCLIAWIVSMFLDICHQKRCVVDAFALSRQKNQQQWRLWTQGKSYPFSVIVAGTGFEVVSVGWHVWCLFQKQIGDKAWHRFMREYQRPWER